LGIILSLYHIEAGAPAEEIEKTVAFLSEDPEIHGVLLQLPLPDVYDKKETDRLIALISDEKDVDALNGSWKKADWRAKTVTDFREISSFFLPPMVCSVFSLLDYYDIESDEGPLVTVGKGRLVGQPILEYAKKLGIDASSVDEETPDILSVTKIAKVLVTGTGEPDLVTYQWVSEGATVIDCSGDVHFDSVSQVAANLSPAKGGVGPLTTVWLLHNVVRAARNTEGEL
ncbi:MAG: methylenetetrahydrofolate dehydrogenase (NADP+)/methenyltetrahydrofolate cyclohydrolase, partial [Patescibacteria group bacterium]|nr:methylenetetrahydrofolate dehydrogenase (NADP+)/methenyltetrahydrofolate cyclohydrolase [Patescibacteria group bacterium]